MITSPGCTVEISRVEMFFVLLPVGYETGLRFSGGRGGGLSSKYDTVSGGIWPLNIALPVPISVAAVGVGVGKGVGIMVGV